MFVKNYESIQLKLEQIKQECQTITFNPKESESLDRKKSTRLIRLVAKEDALRWVLGKGVI